MSIDTIPTLSPDVLQIFTGKKVVIYSENTSRFFFYAALRALGIRCLGFYTPKQYPQPLSFRDKLHGITWFTEAEFLALKKDELIIQLQVNSPAQEALAKSELQGLGFVCSDLAPDAIFRSFFRMVFLRPTTSSWASRCQRALWRLDCEKRVAFSFERYKRNAASKITLLCLPMKTADFTLMNTFNTAGVDYFNFYHNPKFIHRKQLEKQFDTVKIITAVREPISQNMSSFFQVLSGKDVVPNYKDWHFGDLASKMPKDKLLTLEKAIVSQTEDVYQVQALFDAFTTRYAYGDVASIAGLPKSMQAFWAAFQRYVVNITKHPFDQEKGYTIIKEGNIEVFVYQLEKLNSLVPTLSAWVGVPFETLTNGNETSDKWIADIYKQAQKEIEITQEYFDKCFDEPYVKHCYSEADIEKFKARWRPHIKG